jgi:hypothetical protein
VTLPRTKPHEKPSAVSPTHARVLVADFKAIEDYCREIEKWLGDPAGIFSKVEGEIPAESRRIMLKKFAEVYAQLQDIQHDLKLDKVVVDRLRLVDAYLSDAWVALSETNSRHLKAYGAVPKELADYLDPRLEELNSTLKEIRRAAEETRPIVKPL